MRRSCRRNSGLRRSQQRELEHVLTRLERNGQIARIKEGNRYALPLAADLVPGRIRMNRAGVGFLQPDDPKLPTIRISQDATATAMHGDRVLVRRDVLPRIPRRQGAGRGRRAGLFGCWSGRARNWSARSSAAGSSFT